MYPYDYNTLRGNNGNYPVTYAEDGERFFWAPFVVGGLAGTALGYGIANNNYNRPPVYYQPYYYQPYYPPYQMSGPYYY